MKKSRIFILGLLMLSCLSNPSYAEETILQPAIPISNQVEITGIVSKDITIKKVEGFYLNLSLPQSQQETVYIPTFTVNLLNEAGTKVLATTKADESTFDKPLSTYKLVFKDFKDFKLNDKFKLAIISNDPVVKGLSYEGYGRRADSSYTYTEYVITNKDSALITILDKKYTTNQKELTDPNAQITSTLYGNSDYPAGATIITDARKTVIMLKDETGKPMSNLPVKVHGYMTKVDLDAKSDANGLLILETCKIFPTFTLTPNKEGYKAITYSERKDKNGKAVKVENITGTYKGEFPMLVIGEKLEDTVSFKVNVRVKPTVVQGGVVTKFTTSFNTDLSKNWENVTLNLTDSKGNKSAVNVTPTNPGITLEDGIYKVDVAKADYADVNLQTKEIKVVSGKAEIKMTLAPKHVLNISKENQAYKFSIINIEAIKSKIYQATKATVFAVMPGETYMIRDNDSKVVQNVTIVEQAKITKVTLGAGTSYDNVSINPHTGDSMPYLLALLGIITIVLVFCLTMYFKNRKLINMHKNSYLSLFLVGVLIISIFSSVVSKPTVVYADSSGFKLKSGSNGNGVSPDGNLVNDDSGENGHEGNIPGVLRVGFIPTTNLTEDASIADIAPVSKYAWGDTMVYMAPTKRASDIWNNSGFLVKKADDMYIRFGTTPLNDSEPVNVAERTARTLVCNTESDNSFISNISKAAINKNLQTDGVSIGTSLSNVITGNFYGEDAQESRDKFFNDYILLLEKANVSASTISNLKALYAENKVSLFVQSLVGFRMKGSADEDWKNYCYLTVRDALEITAFCIDIPVALNESEVSIFKKLHPSYSKGPKDTRFGGLGGAAFFAVDDFMAQLLPTSTKITADASSKAYGAWGYYHWESNGLKLTTNPKLTADLNVTVIDKTGKATGETFIQPIEDWTEADNRYFIDMYKNLDNATVSTSMTINHNSKFYTIQPQINTPVDFFDITDNEKLNKNPLKMGGFAKNLIIHAPSYDDTSRVEFIVGSHTESLPKDIHKYLGGPTDDSEEVTWESEYYDWYMEDFGGPTETVVQENKYKDKVDTTGKPISSDAKAIIYVKVIDTTPKAMNAEDYEVEQWRISKYWNNISETIQNEATFSMTLASDETSHVTSTLDPEGLVNFSLVNPVVPDWAKSKSKFLGTSATSITHGNTTASLREGGDLLATRLTKDNGIKVASWLSNVTSVSGVETAPVGVTNNYPASYDKSFLFKYGILNPLKYNHHIAKYSHSSGTDSDGNSYDICNCYLSPETPTKNYVTSDYNKTVRYYRYVPKANSAIKLNTTSGAENGFYWETKQDSSILNVNPEVPMAYSDVSGNTSVATVAGDRMRQVLPTSYNFARFDSVSIKPTVIGMAVASDTSAKALANNLGAGKKQVIYRGAGVNVSNEISGTVTAKSFALDIGGASKASWNPSTSYKSEDVNNSFMSKFANKSADGTWIANIGKSGALVINNVRYSVNNGNEAITAKTTVNPHTLVVRAGKLITVDGVAVASLTGDLKVAVEKMGLLDPKGILSVFVKNEGDKLTESNVANLFNATTGTADAEVGKGWYTEGTSMLVINEFVTTFTLPKSHMFSDKVPMSIPGLEAPVNKAMFFKPYQDAMGMNHPGGYTGHIAQELKLPVVSYKYNSTGKTIEYIVPNLSILDSTN